MIPRFIRFLTSTALAMVILGGFSPVKAAAIILHATCNGSTDTLIVTSTGGTDTIATITENGVVDPAYSGNVLTTPTSIQDANTFFPGTNVTVIGQSGSSASTVCTSGTGSPPPTFTDGRINLEPWQTATIYCDQGGVRIYAVYQGVGYLAIVMTKAQLADFPPNPYRNYLIRQNLGVRLYRLSNGWLQVNRAISDNPAKDYSFLWPGCPAA